MTSPTGQPPLDDSKAEVIPDYPLVHEESEPPAPLSTRLRNPRTIISIVVPLFIIVLVLSQLQGFHLDQLPALLAQANPWLLLIAFVIYYIGFPLRGWRWAILLRSAGTEISIRDSTEIIFISWLVNCLVPAKLGDVYRAYLVKVNYGMSLSKVFGTVFIERVFDLFAIVILGLAAGFWSFRDGMSPEVQLVFVIGLVVVAVLAIGLFLIRNFGARLVRRLPLPARVVEFYDRFEEGLFSIRAGQVPLLALLTAAIWATEAFRLYFVVLAMGFDLNMGLSGGLFVALIASLLTAIPFTPAGLGAVEGAVVFILTTLYGATTTQAVAITLVDRTISVLSVILFGGIAYLLSNKTKGPKPTVTTVESAAS
jgi:uncharacterized protein (TIRG00374 family)